MATVLTRIPSCSGKEPPMARHLARGRLIALTAIFAAPLLSAADRPEVFPAVLVNPNIQGNGIAQTIKEGIDMVDPGGRVMVLPGTYNEAIVIDKGLTLEAVGGATEPVIIAPPAPPAGPTVAIQVATPEPVTIRDATLQFTGANGGIRGDGVVDVTVE